MGQDNVQLPDALKSFVKLDNRHFKQELSQSARLGPSPEKKRGPVLGDDSQSKRLQRSASIESIATNHASAGDLDDDMRDAPFDSDSVFFGGDGPADRSASQDATIPDLIEPLPAAAVRDDPSSSLPPVYEHDIEMPAATPPPPPPPLRDDPESARLAQVALRDFKISSSPPPPPAQEMQERPSALLFARPNHGGVAANGGGLTTGGSVDEGSELLIDLSDDHKDAGGFGRGMVDGA